MPDPLYHASAFVPEEREDKINTGLANQEQRQQSRFKRLADRHKHRKKKAGKKSSGRGGGAPAPSPSAPAPDPLIEALVRLRYGGEESALKDSIYASQVNAQRLPGWYDQYIARLGQMQAGAQANAIALQNSMRPGLSTNPAVDTPESQQAANARNNLFQSGLNTIGAQAQNHVTHFDGLKAAGLLGAKDAVAAQENVTRGEQAKFRDLQRQKGDFRATTKMELDAAKSKSRLEERKMLMANAIAQGKLDLASQIASLNAADDVADNRRQSQDSASLRSDRVADNARQDRALTQGQRQKARDKEMKRRADVRKDNAKLRDQTSRAQAILRQYQSSLGGKPLPGRQGLIDLLETSKHGISHKAAVRAVKKFLDSGPQRYGGVGRGADTT